MISLTLSPAAEKLRDDCRKWIASNPPPTISGRIELEKFVDISRAWQRQLAADRFVGVHWPEQYGGRGLSIAEEAIVQECLAAAKSPQLINLFGLTMVGPVLIEHGTEAQRARHLSKILSAEEIWCQGFSEPEAGSDLAAIRTQAIKDTSVTPAIWQISGEKIWTSFAQVADFCFILARSDSGSTRHKGLSYFLMPMRQPGIEITPLPQISGDREFNQLFLEKVAVPSENIVGSEGDGWRIAISTLMYERVVLTFARHLQSENLLGEVRKLLKQNSASDSLQQEYGRLLARNMAVRALALSHLLSYTGSDGEGSLVTSPGPEGSLDKLAWSETFQDICKFALDLQGVDGIINAGERSYGDGLIQYEYLYSRGRSIAAGTSEIQRNIIAERILGLPREGK